MWLPLTLWLYDSPPRPLSGTFYVNDRLKDLLFEELQQVGPPSSVPLAPPDISLKSRQVDPVTQFLQLPSSCALHKLFHLCSELDARVKVLRPATAPEPTPHTVPCLLFLMPHRGGACIPSG